MAGPVSLAWNRSGGKIQSWHQDRLAVVYIRQLTRQQVLEHGESTRLQYGLTERAVWLGWARSRVLVIDEDLGRSGAGAVDRPGFQRLVTEVTMEHVGVVLGIEMSRLARAGKDCISCWSCAACRARCWQMPMGFMIRIAITTACCWA